MFDTLNSGVTSSGILDAAVITNKLNDLAVTTGKLNDLVVTAAKIAAAAVETAKVAASAITALNSAAESIETITSTSATDIGNLTITYTTSAAEGPHMLFFSGETRIKNTHATNTQDIGYRIDVLYDGGLVHRIFGAWPSIAAGKEVITSPGLAFMTTGISAGSHTWKLQGRVLGSDQELTVSGLVGSTSALLTLAEMKK
jgi:hypothetical protein